MENMDIDMVFDIPDTPDRIKAHLREAAGRESSSYARNFCLIDEDHSNKMGNSEKTMRHHNYDHTSSNGDFEKRNGLHPSGKAPLFRRTAVEKDKGKAISIKSPSKVSASFQIDPAKNYNQEDMHRLFCKKGYPHDAAKSLSLSGAQLDGKADKGKEKTDDDTETGKERIILSSPLPHKKDDRILPFDRPAIQAAGRRQLVKNGCISPHAIAAKAKHLAEHNQFSSKNDLPERHLTRKDASNNPSPVDIQDIVMEVNAFDGAEGKRAITHPHISNDDEVQIINVEEIRKGRRETSGSGGWRSTHSRQTRTGHSLPVRNKVSSRGLAPTTSSRSVETEPKSEHSQADKIAIKRGRNSGFASAALDEPEISFFGSSLESSRLRSSDFQNYQNGAMLHHVLQTDDSFSEVCPGGVDGSGSSHSDESEARARQLEADERLARELQMQLDQDAAIFDNDEIDENIAWALQQEESSHQASSSLNHRPHHRSSRRQTRPQLQQNSSNMRTTMPQPNLPARITRSRGNPFGRSPAGILRNWNYRFPTEMDIDSGLDMLEELEAAVDELSGSMDRTNRLLQSGSDFSRMSRLLQFDGDFSEQDYEMLLALDEDNHQHGGASVNQVNNLPQSTVQTDNFEEACAICLETPAKGDVIRHLPCLHKFHKDCIDPWLGRSKSCPVCKSSIS